MVSDNKKLNKAVFYQIFLPKSDGLIFFKNSYSVSMIACLLQIITLVMVALHHQVCFR